MKKVIEEIENLFAKYDCYSLHDLEEQSESFGNSEYDKYYYDDLVFTKHSFDGQFCCFMSLHLKPVDLDKAIFKIEINEKRTFYTLSFRKEEILLIPDWIEYYLKNFCMNSTFLQEERWQAYRKTGRIADEIIYENRCMEEFHKLKEILNA